MRHSSVAVTALLALAADTTTAATLKSTGTPAHAPSVTVAPCAQVSNAWAATHTGKNNHAALVPATLARDCLKSVPLHKKEAIELVDSLEPYLEWQSDAPFKSRPPQDYYYPGFNIFNNLAAVRKKLVEDKYADEYEFQTELYRTVFVAGHDGHYIFYPDAAGSAFRFRRQVSLVSISEDGKSLPVVKLTEEVLTNPRKASAITHINGQDVVEFLQKAADAGAYNQDGDSAYNSLFYEASGGGDGFLTGDRSSLFFQDAFTTLTFANGTNSTTENFATVAGNFKGVTDGESFWNTFIAPKIKVTPEVAPAVARLDAAAEPPKPFIADDQESIAGYYLQGRGVDNVAVLALTSFEGDPAQFQAVLQDFLTESKAAGKTKVVIDFQGNGGGYILLGYEFFRQFFPQAVPDGFSRWRDTDAFRNLGELVSAEVAGVDPNHLNGTSDDLIEDYDNWFNYRHDLNTLGEHFKSADEKFASHLVRNANYTPLYRWDLTDPLDTSNPDFGLGIEISGYGSRSNLTQPFAAEDIVIIYDGVCASTCTLASEFLRLHGGVKSIALGGRPVEGAIQGVGGVKGAQILSFSNIYYLARKGETLTNDTAKLADFARYTDLPLRRTLGASLNVRDQILRDNVHDGTPAQFIREETDCRLYWTAPMIKDITEIWKAAANSAFNGYKCAHGGIKSTRGNTQPVKARAADTTYQRLSDHVKAKKQHEHKDRSPLWFSKHELKVPKLN